MLMLVSVWLNLLSAITAQSDDELSSRILYGERANEKDYSYFASLTNCGAAIISDRWLVTAGHCLPYNRDGRVWVGGDNSENSKWYTYDKVIFHPKYNWLTLYNSKIPWNDIALLRLTKPLVFNDTVKALQLPKQNYETNATYEFVGKGLDETGCTSKYLMKMDVRSLGFEECISHNSWLKMIYIRSYEYVPELLSELTAQIICTARANEEPGMCYGDSGSPLVRNNTLVGLASFIDERKCEHARLGIFVNVAPYVEWIKSVTGIQ